MSCELQYVNSEGCCNEFIRYVLLWGAPMSAEGAEGDCDASLYNLCSIVATGRNAQRLEESKCHSHLQEGQEGGTTHSSTKGPNLGPLEGDRTANPGNHF